MIKLIKDIFRSPFFRTGSTEYPATAGISSDSNTVRTPVEELRHREQQLYGVDYLREQRFYEHWVSKEHWCLKSEALPLFFGVDPETLDATTSADADLANELDTLWLHARHCVEQGLLEVINPESRPEEWQVHPLIAFQWARISRVNLPDNLAALLSFIASTVKRTTMSAEMKENKPDPSARFDSDREKILGMALAILAALPEQCRDDRGQINISRIMTIMGEKKAHWIGDEPLSLSDPAIRDLLSKWLHTLLP